ncbi:MAG: hypothetical protein HYS27_12850 [Deltaproteobacteria bacterium]|nr:hypothetical protein [Deltaproteobacteria bacterium]
MSGKPTPAAALDAILDLTAGQLALLADAAKRPDVDLGGVARTSFDLLLKGIKANVAPLTKDPAVPAETRARIERVVGAVEAWERSTVALGHHLIAVAEGWQCRSCGGDVARTAAVSGVALGKSLIKLELVCAECGARSAPTPKGRKVFEEKFGHLVVAGWNPEANGFQWDRR